MDNNQEMHATEEDLQAFAQIEESEAGGQKMMKSSSFSSLFHEILHDGTTSECPKSWAGSKQTSCYVEAKYFCHIKYDGNQFRYVVQEIIQLSS